MQLSDILKQPINKFMDDKSVLCFNVSQIYPLFFFSLFIKRIRSMQPIAYIDLTEQAEAKSKFETTFLGMTQWYWLGHLDAGVKTQQKEWKEYLQEYRGPNLLLYAVTGDADKRLNDDSVTMPNLVDKKLFRELSLYFLNDPKLVDELYINELFTRTDSLDLESACLLLQYMQIIGVRSKEFFDCWLQKLVVPQHSLFSLSQYFFSKQRVHFFTYWHTIRQEYPEQFWISYWSDQIWRAAFYVKLMQEKKIAEAKKIGYRLPFSFLQKDYRNLTFVELMKVHQWLYEFDYNLKHGADVIGLDNFIYHFFASTLKS